MIPWVVSGNVDHEKVIEKFGCDRIDESLIARVERFTASAGAAYYLSSSKKRRGLIPKFKTFHSFFSGFRISMYFCNKFRLRSV